MGGHTELFSVRNPLTSRAGQSLECKMSTPGATGRPRLAHGHMRGIGSPPPGRAAQDLAGQCSTWEGPSKVVPRPGRGYELAEWLHAQARVKCDVTFHVLHLHHCGQEAAGRRQNSSTPDAQGESPSSCISSSALTAKETCLPSIPWSLSRCWMVNWGRRGKTFITGKGRSCQ